MRYGVAGCVAILATLALFAIGPTHAASFDCAQARTSIERMICSSPELSLLDQQLATTYKAAIAKTADPEQLKTAQRSWLRDVRGKCQTGLCLTEVYKQRVAALAPQPPQAQAPVVLPNFAPPTPVPQVAQSVQPSDAIARCDALAAHPDDPERVTAGIANEKVNASAAIPACEAAIKTAPSTPRLHFQLARSYLAGDRLENAVEELILAAQENHGGALAYLADLHLDGAPGIDADPQLAHRLYQKSLASDFQPAKKILAEFEDKTAEFASAEQHEASANTAGNSSGQSYSYMHGDIIEAISSRQFDRIPYDEQWVKAYLTNIAENIQTICGASITSSPVDQLKRAADAEPFNLSSNAFGSGMKGNWNTKTYNSYLVSYFGKDAESNSGIEILEGSLNDTGALLQRNSCGSANLSQFGRNLQIFVENGEAPTPKEDSIYAACLDDGNRGSARGWEYCACFCTRLSQVPVSQRDRKLLLTSFAAASRSIMDQSEKTRNSFYLCRGR